jgi:hypothetical protein
VVLVFEKHLFGDNVASESDGRDTESGEGPSEALEAGEGTGVSPLLTV